MAEIDYQLDALTALRERKGKLLERGFVARSEMADLDRSIARYCRMRSNVAEAHSSAESAQPQQASQLRQSINLITTNLSLARSSLDSLRIKAPESGIVTSLKAELGEAKAPGERIGQIDSINAFKVRANVDQFYLARVALGQKASAQIGGHSYGLEVAKVYPDVKNRQFAIDLKFAEMTPALRRGQTVQLKLEIGQSGKSVILDNGPSYDETGGHWAFVLSPAGSSRSFAHDCAGLTIHSAAIVLTRRDRKKRARHTVTVGHAFCSPQTQKALHEAGQLHLVHGCGGRI